MLALRLSQVFLALASPDQPGVPVVAGQRGLLRVGAPVFPREAESEPSELLEVSLNLNLKQRLQRLDRTAAGLPAADSTPGGSGGGATYTNIGTGVCGCKPPELLRAATGAPNEVGFCKSHVFLYNVGESSQRPDSQGVWSKGRRVMGSDSDCRQLCSGQKDCMAYQFNSDCWLYLWYQVPVGVLQGEKDLPRRDVGGFPNVWMKLTGSACYVKDPEFRGNFRSQFPIMARIVPSETDPMPISYGVCMCGSAPGNAAVCKVADEKQNLSQEDAEKQCAGRNERQDGGGCAGFMVFNSFSRHPKARSVLFFAGGQDVTSAYETNGTIGWTKKPPAGDPGDIQRALAYLGPLEPTRELSGFDTMPNMDQARCLYVPSQSSVGPDADAAGGHDRVISVTARDAFDKIEEDDRLRFHFNLAVAGVAVFSAALVVVAVLLVLACRRQTSLRNRDRRGAAGRPVKTRPAHDRAHEQAASSLGDQRTSGDAELQVVEKGANKKIKVPPPTVQAGAAASSVRWGVPLSARHVLKVEDKTRPLRADGVRAPDETSWRYEEGGDVVAEDGGVAVADESARVSAEHDQEPTSSSNAHMISPSGEPTPTNPSTDKSSGGEVRLMLGEDLMMSLRQVEGIVGAGRGALLSNDGRGRGSRDGQSVTRATGYEKS